MENNTVILANGDFPKKNGAAWRLLVAAKRVVCCDGAANAYHRHFRKWPSVIIGDLDSLEVKSVDGRWVVGSGRSSSDQRPTVVRCSDQDTNDLEKAFAYCVKQDWRDLVIVGATGKREDHAIGNVFRSLDYGCEIVTDCGRFIPVRDKVTLKTGKGTAVSIFAPDPKTRMTSKGLEWPLDGVKFSNLYCATLNRATGSRVVLTTTKPVSVFVEQREAN